MNKQEIITRHRHAPTIFSLWKRAARKESYEGGGGDAARGAAAWLRPRNGNVRRIGAVAVDRVTLTLTVKALGQSLGEGSGVAAAAHGRGHGFSPAVAFACAFQYRAPARRRIPSRGGARCSRRRAAWQRSRLAPAGGPWPERPPHIARSRHPCPSLRTARRGQPRLTREKLHVSRQPRPAKALPWDDAHRQAHAAAVFRAVLTEIRALFGQ